MHNHLNTAKLFSPTSRVRLHPTVKCGASIAPRHCLIGSTLFFVFVGKFPSENSFVWHSMKAPASHHPTPCYWQLLSDERNSIVHTVSAPYYTCCCERVRKWHYQFINFIISSGCDTDAWRWLHSPSFCRRVKLMNFVLSSVRHLNHKMIKWNWKIEFSVSPAPNPNPMCVVNVILIYLATSWNAVQSIAWQT